MSKVTRIPEMCRQSSRLWAFVCGVGLLCSCAVAEANAEETIRSPYARGGVVSIVETETLKRYVHVFTNTAEVTRFRNRSGQALHGRILVVGAGGAGGYGYDGASGGGGGGGGGGVWERKGLSIPSDACWDIIVGKGARASSQGALTNDTAGASSISNGMACIALVPGGGNGGESSAASSISKGHEATTGAAGGGGIRAVKAGAEGTYASLIFGGAYGPFSGGTATMYQGGGGGGAGATATGTGDNQPNGGEGLASDITGVSLVYGSGGGGGGNILKSLESVYPSGTGGSRAGTGAFATVEDSVATLTDATVPALNSGCGGAGGLGGSYSGKGTAHYGTSGADGIVIIAYEFYKIPFVGGEVTKIAEEGDTSTYIHTFTNVSEVATLENLTGEDIPVRVLVVGAGGAGGYGLQTVSGGGGGGGGGGVLVSNATMSADSSWNVLVGKGATAPTSQISSPIDTAGSSSISNDTACIALVPGGGNGAAGYSQTDGDIYCHVATTGAAGGGGNRAEMAGAEGTYPSSIDGATYGPFSGGGGTTYRGGGGGGAGATATGGYKQNGGEGLASDITGDSLVYGSGGGGGGTITSSAETYPNGTGGTRAGDGAFATVANASTNMTEATMPAPNSGCGGAGGLGGKFNNKGTARWGTSGADGIVVIRYDWTYNPNPPVFGFKLIIQ